MRILVVDDEEMIIEFLTRALALDGHDVDKAYDGAEGLQKALTHQYDAMILDVLMPERDGLSVCRELRERGNSMPVLMLSTRHTAHDRVSGLDSGADDYLIKPFTYDELAARLRALHRRPHDMLPSVVKIGDLSVDPARKLVTKANAEVNLTAREFEVLEYLCAHHNRAVSKEELLTKLWGVNLRNSSNRVEACIKSIRLKLEGPNLPSSESCIETVRSFGYAMRQPKTPTAEAA